MIRDRRRSRRTEDPEFYANRRKAAVNFTLGFYALLYKHGFTSKDVAVLLDAEGANSTRNLKHSGFDPNQIIAVSNDEAEKIKEHHHRVSSDNLFDVLSTLDPNTLGILFADYCTKYQTYGAADLELAFSRRLFKATGSILALTCNFRDNTKKRNAQNDFAANHVTELAERNGYRVRPLPGGHSYRTVFTHFYLIENQAQAMNARPVTYALPAHFDSSTLLESCTDKQRDMLAYIAAGATQIELKILGYRHPRKLIHRWIRNKYPLAKLPQSWEPILQIIAREEFTRQGFALPNLQADLAARAQPLMDVLHDPKALAQFLSRTLLPHAKHVVRLSAQGLTQTEIGKQLGKLPHSIGKTLTASYNRLGIRLTDRHQIEPFICNTPS